VRKRCAPQFRRAARCKAHQVIDHQKQRTGRCIYGAIIILPQWNSTGRVLVKDYTTERNGSLTTKQPSLKMFAYIFKLIISSSTSLQKLKSRLHDGFAFQRLQHQPSNQKLDVLPVRCLKCKIIALVERSHINGYIVRRRCRSEEIRLAAGRSGQSHMNWLTAGRSG